MIKIGVQAIRDEFIRKLAAEEFVIDKTGVKTIEILNASFIADEEYIFGTPNHDYIARELAWYKSTSLLVADIPGKTPIIWEQVSSKDGEINSNYGWCIYSADNGLQYHSCLNQLMADKDSRRACMIYTRPSMQTDYNRDGMSDFMCTYSVQYMIRDNKLNAHVLMRSNDSRFGYMNDYAWQDHVLNELLSDLRAKYPNLDKGVIFWNAMSLHVYERHFNLVV